MRPRLKPMLRARPSKQKKRVTPPKTTRLRRMGRPKKKLLMVKQKNKMVRPTRKPPARRQRPKKKQLKRRQRPKVREKPSKQKKTLLRLRKSRKT